MAKLIEFDEVGLKSRVKVVQIVPESKRRRRVMDIGITKGVEGEKVC